jgi:Rhs element Vgr protein
VSGRTVTATISSEGRTLDPQVQVLAIDVEKEIDRIPRAQIVVVDGSPLGEFPVSDSDFFAPGARVTIQLRREGEPDVTVFDGLAVRQRIDLSAQGSSLCVELRDRAIALTHPRRSVVHREKSDQAVIEAMLSEAGLGKGSFPGSSPQHVELVQHQATNWDFLLSRADACGSAVVVDDGVLSWIAFGKSSGTQHKLQYGIDEIHALEAELDATRQVPAVDARGWDVANLAPTQAHAAAELKLAQGEGNAPPDALAQSLGRGPLHLSHVVPFHSAEEIQQWADARLARSRLALLRGHLALPGRADIKLLDEIELAGFGARFNGTALVSAVRQRVTSGGWRTDLQLGLSADAFCERPDVAAPRAAGLLPPVSGLQLGIVQAFEDDDTKQSRVRVLLPGLSDDPDESGVWARLATPDAGPRRGIFFPPEPGDEVVVGFLGDDPRQPIVLGGLFGKKNEVPFQPEARNELRAIVSRSDTRIELFDGEKPSLTIKTPGGCVAVLDDDSESIELRDPHGNTVRMDSSGVTITSAADFTLDAGKGNVAIKGKKVDIQ